MRETLFYTFKSAEKIEHSGSVNEDDPAQAGVNHGDRVIADGLCWKMIKERGAGTPLATIVRPDEYPPMSLGWLMERSKRDEVEVAEW